jgi:hypothetical protein
MNWDYVRGKKTKRKIKINKQKGNKKKNFFFIVKYLSRDILSTEVSHKGKSCSIFLNEHNFICSKFCKHYNYNINILHNKTTSLCFIDGYGRR